MGKLRHNKDRLFLTGVEWKALGGFKEKRSGVLKKLPFDHCALSLVPFETPMMAPDGSVFELTRIVPFIKSHKKNPVTGEQLEMKQLIALNFSKNTDNQYICPVTGQCDGPILAYCKPVHRHSFLPQRVSQAKLSLITHESLLFVRRVMSFSGMPFNSYA